MLFVYRATCLYITVYLIWLLSGTETNLSLHKSLVNFEVYNKYHNILCYTEQSNAVVWNLKTKTYVLRESYTSYIVSVARVRRNLPDHKIHENSLIHILHFTNINSWYS